eukprot:scaffold32073_cov31-Tisochrysis_lutea.AAC.1
MPHTEGARHRRMPLTGTWRRRGCAQSSAAWRCSRMQHRHQAARSRWGQPIASGASGGRWRGPPTYVSACRAHACRSRHRP